MALFRNDDNIEKSASAPRTGSSKNRSMLEKANIDYQQQYHANIDNHIRLSPGYDYAQSMQMAGSIFFKKVCALSRTNQEYAASAMYEQIKKVILALWTMKAMFVTYIHSDGNAISIYVGTNKKADTLQHIYEGAVNGIEFDTKTYTWNDFLDMNAVFMGAFHGSPVVKKINSSTSEFSVFDELMTGTFGISWNLLISAVPVEYEETNRMFSDWTARTTESSEYVHATFTSLSGGSESMSTEKKYIGAETFCKFADNYCHVLKESLQNGQWRVTVSGFAPDEDSLSLLGSLYSSLLLSGEDTIERPFPIRFYRVRDPISPVSALYGDERTSFCMSSNELASMCPFPVKDVFGLKVTDYSEFDVSVNNHHNFCIGNIISHSKETHVKYTIDVHSLNRHGLVIGLTGGGKSNTVQSILKTIRDFSIPFMVIEPAKKEYYEIYKFGMTDLQVYSVGSSGPNILKINPFECIAGTPIQQHIEAVFAAFKASFIMYTPMPYYLEKAIYEIYTDRGWDIESNTNIYGRTEYPTLEDLYYKIEPIIRNDGFDAKMQKDLTGSLKARINSLRIGSKGRTLNVAKSFPISHLLNGHTVIELDDVGDEDAKAFIISIILMQIQEYRKSQESHYQHQLKHLLLIEEAHRLLKNVPSGTGENADPRGAAVEYFCNMLAELRSKGQGFLVIDQIPSKLAPDLIKNTNMKIVHRTVDTEDRELVGGSMHMDDRQKEYLACIRQGVAAVYSEGDHRPKLVKMPFAGNYQQVSLKNMSRAEIIEKSLSNNFQQINDLDYVDQKKINRLCSMCQYKNNCFASQPPYGLLTSVFNSEDIQELLDCFNSANEKKQIKDFFSLVDQKLTLHSTIQTFSADEIKNCIFAVCIREYGKNIDDNRMSSLYERCMKDINEK